MEISRPRMQLLCRKRGKSKKRYIDMNDESLFVLQMYQRIRFTNCTISSRTRKRKSCTPFYSRICNRRPNSRRCYERSSRHCLPISVNTSIQDDTALPNKKDLKDTGDLAMRNGNCDLTRIQYRATYDMRMYSTKGNFFSSSSERFIDGTMTFEVVQFLRLSIFHLFK
jgi:hypothetical protein